MGTASSATRWRRASSSIASSDLGGVLALGDEHPVHAATSRAQQLQDRAAALDLLSPEALAVARRGAARRASAGGASPCAGACARGRGRGLTAARPGRPRWPRPPRRGRWAEALGGRRLDRDDAADHRAEALGHLRACGRPGAGRSAMIVTSAEIARRPAPLDEGHGAREQLARRDPGDRRVAVGEVAAEVAELRPRPAARRRARGSRRRRRSGRPAPAPRAARPGRGRGRARGRRSRGGRR